MGINITYMGTKRSLAPAVSEVIADAQRGILLDAFSGMCSVGEAVGQYGRFGIMISRFLLQK